ncbi:AEC family transporter [Staphylococcus carnosus]|uniref:AEC family transporter n=1 Tax=Staphylococcus carnosus (strain TM300) TaxID=396513 RepID=B9DLZ7_STACT|nr:AEC family transporter [Staphylococcus carnosus]ANZ32746.1 malonate transporter [Staphylococcus carnosus]KOR12796.1 malonate transporter [Staphylococcus carnosus]QPT04740.1 AEC family transporter [Staphylococcus carnosus]UQA67465.1 AEC family transporter [Staphylococcus carnosus]UTB77702.1 malonate transporter [Staphylococcus carnosus]
MTGKFVIIVLLIALGYFLKRVKLLKEDDSQVLATLVLNVTLPALVIVNLNKADLDISLSILPIMMVIYGIVAKIIAISFFLKYDNEMRGTIGMMMASLNIGLFAYPLVQAIWPKVGMVYFGMADIGGAIVMFGITYFVAGYFSSGDNTFNVKFLLVNLLRSVPLMTYLIMFGLNMSNIHIPGAAINFFDVLSKANMPLSMILLGLMLNFRIERKYLPIAFKYLLIHYGFGIIAGLLVYFFLPVSDQMIKTTLMVIWLLPIGVAVIPYSLQFKYRTMPIIGMTTNMTILISIVILYLYQMFFV